MKHLFRTFGLALAGAAALAACGGGDDPQAPTITTQPASLSVGEGARAVFSVAAAGDGPLAYAWLNANDASPVPGATADTLTIAAAALADNGMSFQARVSNAVGSATSQAATLTVTERGYSAAADVVAGAAPRNLAAIADSSGHIHVLSINGDAANADVQAHLKLKSADSTQTNALLPLTTLQTSAPLTAPTTSLRMAANASGHVMAVWHRNGLVGAALYTPAANPDAAGTWRLLPTRISNFGAASALDPAVAAVGNTGFEFVWRERSGSAGAHDIKARRYTIAGDQLDSTIATIEAASDDTSAPQIVADAAGNLLAAWGYSEGGVVFNRRAAGSAWGTSTTLAEGAPGYQFELLKANAAGKGLLLASNRVGGGTFVQLDLASVTPMSTVGAYNAYGSAPDAHIFPDGRIRLFGVSVNTANGNVSRLFQWAFQPGAGWGGAEPVSAISANDFIATGHGILNPQVAGADAAGNLLVAWEERNSADAGRGRIQTRRWLAGQNAWRAVATVSPTATTVDHREPLGAMAGDGSATVVYRDAARNASAAVHLR